jgi:DnaK suppressor protein
MTPDEILDAERRRLEPHIADLARDLQAIIDASADTNADDEHDPEGSTIGFERAQVASLLDEARSRLAAVDQAEARLRTGTYGRCETCDGLIAPDRLAAHPTAVRCVACASESAGRARFRPR